MKRNSANDKNLNFKKSNKACLAGRSKHLPLKRSSSSPPDTPFLLETSMYRGYVKLWRKTTDWAFYNKPIALALWVTLLCEANHKETRKIFKGKIITIRPGQILTGRKYIAQLTGISESSIEKYLNWFETEKQLIQQKSNVNRLITITNWNTYQNNSKEDTQPPRQQKDNRKTTERQQKDTPKNDKNVKNDNNKIKPPADSFKEPFPKPTAIQKKELAKLQVELSKSPFSFNLYSLMARIKKVRGYYPPINSMINISKYVLKNKPANIWGYFTNALKEEFPKQFADLNIQENERFKKEPTSMKAIMNQIGK